MTEQERKKRIERRRRRRRRELILRIEGALLAILFVILAVIIVREVRKNTAEPETTQGSVDEPGQEVSKDGSVGTVGNADENAGAGDETDYETAQNEPDGLQNDQEQNENLQEPADASELAEDAARKRGNGDGEAVLAFGGDICFHDAYANMGSYVQRGNNIENCISADLLKEMREAEVLMVNNEFVYTNRGEPTMDKTYTLRSKPENVSILTDMGVDVVSLANNHAYDYGEISLLDTLDTLEKEQIPYVGAGRNLEEASKAALFTVDGIKIAILSATQIERLDNPDTKGATTEAAGVFRCWGNELEQLLEEIKEAKQENNFVVVYIHWGTENSETIDWAQEQQAVKIAEAGADLIVGDHPHCLQKMGYVSGVPVIYSLGNFWFNSKTIDTGLLKVTVDKEGLKSCQFLPAVQANCTTTLSTGAEKERILTYMRELSTGINIDAEGFMTP